MLFLHNTSHVEDEPYPRLLTEKGFGGFPSICFMDAEGNVLTKPARSVAAFVEMHARTKRMMALRAKGDHATPADKKELFLTELMLDMIAADEIRSRSEQVQGLSAAEKAMVEQKLVDAEVGQLMRNARDLGYEKLGERMAEMAKAGRVPSASMSGTFWPPVLGYASTHKDAELAQQAYDALVRHYASETGGRIEQYKAAWQKLVDEAKAR